MLDVTESHVLGELDGYSFRDAEDYSRKEDAEMRRRSDACEVISGAIRDLLAEDSTTGKVFSIYGIGGQGKSYLLKSVYESLLDSSNENVIAPFHSFEGDETLAAELLLKEIAELLEYHGIPCSRFSITYYAFRACSLDIRRAIDEFASDYERASKSQSSGVVTTVLEMTAPVFDYLSSALGSPLPTGSIFASIARLVRGSSNATTKTELEERWRSLSKGLSASKLSGQLVPMLKNDIASWLEEHEGKRIVFFLDTFEKLGWGSTDHRGRYEWVRDLSLTPGTMWVIAGRVRVPWGNVIQFPIQLVELTHQEVVDLLNSEGITDLEMQAEIEQLTRGLPIYVSICVDLLKEREATVEQLKEAGTRERLPWLYLKYLDSRDISSAAHVASFLESWDIDLITEATRGIVAVSSIDVLNNVSFVTNRGDRWEMHEVVAEVLRSSDSITVLKRILWKRLCEMEREARSNSALPEVERQRRVTHLLRSVSRLLDEGVSGVTREEAFRKYMEYAEEVWRNGDIDSAMSLFSAILAKFGSEDDLNPEYLQAKLKEGAIETQLYLAGRGVKHHMRAIELAEEVLEQARAKFPGNTVIIRSALNDLGVSWARLGREDIANYEKALFYQEGLYREMSAKDPRDFTSDEARFINNYGTTCQQYGDALSNPDRKRSLYEHAREAYEKSYQARRKLFGECSRQALLTQTNYGVIQARLGDLDKAETIIKSVKADYERGGFSQAYPGYVRCSFQLANFDVQRAEKLMDSNREAALQILENALKLHKSVYKIRAESVSPDSVDAKKSADQVERCEQLIARLTEASAGR